MRRTTPPAAGAVGGARCPAGPKRAGSGGRPRRAGGRGGGGGGPHSSLDSLVSGAVANSSPDDCEETDETGEGVCFLFIIKMNDLRKYSGEFLVEFIDLYKSLPVVWKIKSKEYSNRDMKTQAYEILVRKWKEVEPSADRDFVMNKINNMRSVYRRELKKINTEYSECSGMGSDEVPSPSLWYFHLLDFLRDQEMPRPSMSSMDEENTQQLDRFDYMAKSWSETLRILPNQQRIIAEKIINGVFFEAQLNTLTREGHLQVENGRTW
ncbi:uncharacterized protein LOC134795217 [Cydia splendana]|uniref:uncharacterized protein LOC134795217 n=1 Tax=Cydia splendana TaxID=1100963 RepID=UPI00300C3784